MREEPGIAAAGLPVDSELPDRVGVLVLGGGLAGAAALLAAAEAGQYAVLLEKTDAFGGSTVRSAGLSAFVGTDEQHEQGIADSVELLRKDLLETGGHVNDEALVDLYCERAAGHVPLAQGPRGPLRTHPRRLGTVRAAVTPDRHDGDAAGALLGRGAARRAPGRSAPTSSGSSTTARA